MCHQIRVDGSVEGHQSSINAYKRRAVLSDSIQYSILSSLLSNLNSSRRLTGPLSEDYKCQSCSRHPYLKKRQKVMCKLTRSFSSKQTTSCTYCCDITEVCDTSIHQACCIQTNKNIGFLYFSMFFYSFCYFSLYFLTVFHH